MRNAGSIPTMKPGPLANSFTAASSIFNVLERAEKRGAVTVKWVRDALGVSDRQARDYLAFLVSRGRLSVVKRGRTNEYVCARHGDAGVDVMQQAVGAEFAVAALGALKGTAFHEAAVEHVATLRRDLRSMQGVRAERLRSAFYAVRGSVPLNRQHAANAEEILNAIMLGHVIRARYETVADGSVKSYELRPLWLVLDEGLHLIARRRDGKVRTFDVEGFVSVERLKRAAPPSALDVETYFAHAFGRYTDFPPEEVVLRLQDKAARQVRRRSYHASQVVVEDQGGILLVRYRLGLCPEFRSWLLGLAPHVEVIAPSELRVWMHQIHAAGKTLNA